MRVLRVESVHGLGPFETGYSNGIFNAKNYNTMEYPLPREDGIDQECNYYCGCITLDQIVHWFGDVVHCIHNYLVVEYEIDESLVRIGRTQCLFDKKSALVVSKISVGELFS